MTSIFGPKKGHEQDMSLLLPWFRSRVESVISRMADQGFVAILFEGLRSVAEANRNALLGRGVTESMHLFGAAADLICAHHGWDCRAKGCQFYDALADAAESEGLVSGWRWKKKDGPHIQAVKVGAGQAILRLLGSGKDTEALRDWWCSAQTTEAVYRKLCEFRNSTYSGDPRKRQEALEYSCTVQMFCLLEGLPIRKDLYHTNSGMRDALNAWARRTGVSYSLAPVVPVTKVPRGPRPPRGR
jgi:hypothetical protein